MFPELGISVQVLKVKGSTVRLGIQAPKDIRITRGELVPKEEETSSEQWDNYEIRIPLNQSRQNLAKVCLEAVAFERSG